MCISIFDHAKRETVFELIFLRYYLESATQRSPMRFISEDSEEENFDDEENEEDKALRFLSFFLRRLCFSEKGEDFSVKED